MLHRHSEGPVSAATENEALGDKLAGLIVPSAKPRKRKTQDAITAQLVGSDQCSAEGITACSHTPVLDLCRRLIAAGVDADRPLIAYRNTTACIIVRSIRAGAKLTVDEHNGTVFAKWKAFVSSAVSPGMRQKRRAVTTPAGGAP